jgi:hypothetical protein
MPDTQKLGTGKPTVGWPTVGALSNGAANSKPANSRCLSNGAAGITDCFSEDLLNSVLICPAKPHLFDLMNDILVPSKSSRQKNNAHTTI